LAKGVGLLTATIKINATTTQIRKATRSCEHFHGLDLSFG